MHFNLDCRQSSGHEVPSLRKIDDCVTLSIVATSSVPEAKVLSQDVVEECRIGALKRSLYLMLELRNLGGDGVAT
jgi:hypothetical protein